VDETAYHDLEEQLSALGLAISRKIQSRLFWFAEELLRWNRRINLTAITRLDEVINKHLIDSLTLLPRIKDNERMLDIGSGGGFPGLPIKIVKEDLRLVSVDAVAKKISFQGHIVRRLNLTHCTLLNMRGEELPHWSGLEKGFDTIVARAFSSLENIIQLGFPCMGARGRLVAMKGPEGEKELQNALPLLNRLNLICVDIKKLRLPVSNAERVLIFLMKKPG